MAREPLCAISQCRPPSFIETQSRDYGVVVRLTDLDTSELRDVALSLGRGGVGYYHESDFVHVDTGRVRRW